MDELTKEQMLARVSNAIDMGLMTRKQIGLLDKWLDFVLRLEGGQMNYVAEFMESEKRRTSHFARTLASDDEGYALNRLAAVLSHPCQQCAEDPKAWHTRSAFCPHKDKVSSCYGDDNHGF